MRLIGIGWPVLREKFAIWKIWTIKK